MSNINFQFVPAKHRWDENDEEVLSRIRAGYDGCCLWFWSFLLCTGVLTAAVAFSVYSGLLFGETSAANVPSFAWAVLAGAIVCSMCCCWLCCCGYMYPLLRTSMSMPEPDRGPLFNEQLHVDAKRVLCLVNPMSGNKTGQKLYETVVEPELRKRIEHVDLQYTERAGHFRELGETLDVSSYDVVCIMGGDGSMHEFINGLLLRDEFRERSGGGGNKKSGGSRRGGRKVRVEDYPVLASLPVGTANVIAKDVASFKAHRRVESLRRAAAQVADGHCGRLDLLKCSLGPVSADSRRRRTVFGVFTAVHGRLLELLHVADSQRQRSRFWVMASLIPSAFALTTQRQRVVLTATNADGEPSRTLRESEAGSAWETVDASVVLVSTNQSAAIGQAAPFGAWDDGRAEVSVVRAEHRAGMMATFLRMGCGRVSRNNAVWASDVDADGAAGRGRGRGRGGRGRGRSAGPHHRRRLDSSSADTLLPKEATPVRWEDVDGLQEMGSVRALLMRFVDEDPASSSGTINIDGETYTYHGDKVEVRCVQSPFRLICSEKCFHA